MGISYPAGLANGNAQPVDTTPVGGVPNYSTTPIATGANAQNQGPAPAGSQLSANKLYYDSSGNSYASAPNTNTAGVGTTTGAGGPAGAPQTESEIYGSLVTQGQGVIDSLNASRDAAIQQSNLTYDTAASESQQNQNAVAAITGGFGSSAAGGAGAIAGDAANKKASANAGIQAQTQQQIATYLNNLQTLATNQANTESEDYYKNALPQIQSNLAGLVKNGLTFQQLSTNPALASTYQSLLQAFGGDPNVLAANMANATPVNTVQQQWVVGNTLEQLVVNPQTGVPSIQSFTLPVTPPQGATVTKIGTNGSYLQFPDGSAVTITLNPLGTGFSASATGATGSAGQNYASQLNSSQSGGSSSAASGTNDTSGNSGAGNSAAATNYVSTVAGTTGTSTTATWDSVVNGDNAPGIASVINGVVQAEGGSPQGVSNNPGNVLYDPSAILPGETNSKVPVPGSPGSYYASFDTAENGNSAIASTLGAIAKNQGAGATLASVLGTYNGLGGTNGDSSDSTSPTTGTNGLSTTEYGLLANVDGFDPGKPGSSNQTESQVIDQGAFNWLQSYLSTGTQPAASGGMGGLSAKVYQSDVQARAEELYKDATGQSLPNATELSSNLDLLTGNNAMLSSLGVNAPTISANAKLLENKITAANINQNAPAINAIIDPIIQALGNPAVASYMAQNSTLSNELGSLLALKNAGGAGGSTVHDKLAAADLIDKNSNATQIAAAVNTVLQEASNANSAINTANLNLYLQTDPMQINPQNPLNQTTTFADPNGGQPLSFAPGALTSSEAQMLLSNGYSIEATNASGGND